MRRAVVEEVAVYPVATLAETVDFLLGNRAIERAQAGIESVDCHEAGAAKIRRVGNYPRDKKILWQGVGVQPF